jgi:hypothetical protein
MAAEEIAQELEILRAIYADDFKELPGSPTKCSVELWPSAGAADGQAGVLITVTYPAKDYPQQLPDLTIVPKKRLVEADVAKLKTHLLELGKQNIGSAMVFTMTSAAKEWLDEQDTRLLKEQEATKQAKERQLELEEQKKQLRLEQEAAKRIGTRVTKDSFKAWEAKFALEEEKKRAQATAADAARRTGRIMFEQDASLVMSDDVFIKKMEASLGSSTGSAAEAELPPPPAQALLSDPKNAGLFGDFVDDEEDPGDDTDDA